MGEDTLKILVDADMIVFKACSTIETPINWYDDLWTVHADAGEAKGIVDDMVLSMVDKVLRHYNYEGNYEIIMCFTDKDDNFRKHIYPLYKANRVGKRKPSGYYGVMKWCEENYKCVSKPSLEADDVIGILATKYDDCIIISGDKDFKTIPAHFYDFCRDKFYEISKQEADYWHLYQTLIGDTTDNYKGCPKCGDVTARRLLDEDCSWKTVVSAFEKQGLSENDALTQARVARILRAEDYNFKTHKPILWTPKL